LTYRNGCKIISFSNYPTEVFRWLFPREGLQAGEGIKEGLKTFFAKLKVRALAECPNCGEMTMPHRVCPYCGYYKGKQVLNKV